MRRASLDSMWSDVKRLACITERVNKRYARYFKSKEGVSYTPDLISPYKVEELVKKAKRGLVELAVRLTFERHGVNNITVEESVVDKLTEGDFDEENISAYIKENYVAKADELAFSEILNEARGLVPTFWDEQGWRRDATVEDLVKGRRLRLQVYWSYGNLSYHSEGEIIALEKLIGIVLGGKKPSNIGLGQGSMHSLLWKWRTLEPYSQARKYVYVTDYINSFRVYKNGKFEIEFKKEEYARKVAEALIGA